MNRTLLALTALVAGALLIPDLAEAQRGGRGGGGFGGGGARMGGGGFGGGGFRGGSFGGGGFGGQRMYIPRGGLGGSRISGGPLTTGSINRSGRVPGIAPGAGGFRRVAINNPGRFGNRGDWRRYGAVGGRYPYYGGRYGYYRGRYPYYGRYYNRYPYYGLAAGALIGAAATYPYYNYPYYDYPYTTYQTPIASAAGGYCVTPVRTCALINAAPIGTGCSCSTPGGRARGTVQ